MNKFKELLVRGVAWYAKAIFATTDYVKEKTGFDLEKKMIEMNEQEERERKEHPFRWGLKKLLKGTVQGTISGSMH